MKQLLFMIERECIAMERKLFCEISPFTYKLSMQKEWCIKFAKDLVGGEKFAKEIKSEPLDNLVKSHASILIRKLNGVDLTLQQNKVTNLRIASSKFNGIVIHPGETFSYWRMVGNPTEDKGYLPGLTISARQKMGNGVGGGLCQLANMVHWLVLQSPLEVTELHHHSDALFPDERRKVPFGTGTSVFYSKLDYRFKNTTDQDVQILVWLDDEYLNGELRSERAFPYKYRIVEENDHFRNENGTFYRISQIYKLTLDRDTGEELKKEVILDNHSKVLYDYSLIPAEKIRND